MDGEPTLRHHLPLRGDQRPPERHGASNIAQTAEKRSPCLTTLRTSRLLRAETVFLWSALHLFRPDDRLSPRKV